MHTIVISFVIAVVSGGSIFIVAYQVTAAEYATRSVETSTLRNDPSVTVTGADAEGPEEQTFAHVTGAQTARVHRDEERVGRTELLNRQQPEPEVARTVPLDRIDVGQIGHGADTPVLQPPSGAGVEEAPDSEQPIISSTYEHELVRMIFDLTNRERKQEGLTPLVSDGALTRIAQSHSDDMVAHERLTHKSSDGCALACRFQEHGYTATAWAENISYIENSDLLSYEAAAAYVVESWMESEAHRRNILSDIYTHTGVAFSSDGEDVYVTVEFAQK